MQCCVITVIVFMPVLNIYLLNFISPNRTVAKFGQYHDQNKFILCGYTLTICLCSESAQAALNDTVEWLNEGGDVAVSCVTAVSSPNHILLNPVCFLCCYWSSVSQVVRHTAKKIQDLRANRFLRQIVRKRCLTESRLVI